MIRRTTRIALEVAAGIVGVFILLVGVAFWRLSTGPVPLDFLTPRIERALSDPVSGPTVRVGATELIWAGWDRTVDLVTRDVRIRDRDGGAIASLPDAVVRLSLRALAHGIVAPTMVELHDVRLSLQRLEDGTFTLGLWDEQAADVAGGADFSRVLPSIIEDLLSPPKVEEPVSFLTAVRILDGRIFVNDRQLSIIWQAPVANIELRRDAAGLAGDVGLAIDLGGELAHVAAGFLYDSTTERIDLTADFTALHPKALVPLTPQLQLLAGLSTPLDGSISASVGVDGAIDSVHLEMTGGSGTLSLPGILPEALPIRRIALAGHVSGPDRRTEIESATVSLGTDDDPGPVISASGVLTSSADDFGGDLEIEADVQASDLPMEEIERYWPEPVGENERKWVLRNIPRGTVDRISLQTALRVPHGDLEKTELRRIEGTLLYHDLEIHFLRPMPPVVGVSGTGKFDHTSLSFSPEIGRLGQIEIRPSAVTISGLDTRPQSMRLDLAAVGPLPEVLGLLDHDRLALIRRLGLDPSSTEGRAGVRVEFRFPLLDALTFDEIEVTANASLDGVGVKAFLLGQDATEGDLSLALDKTEMRISGPLLLGGVPMEVLWNEAFTGKAPHRTNLQVQVGHIDETDWRAFGLDLTPYLTGPVSTSILATLDDDGTGAIKAAVNLEQAELALDTLSWNKPAGISGEAYLTLWLQDERPTELSRIDVNAGTLRALGRGTFDTAGRGLSALTLDELAFDGTSLTEVSVDLGDGAPVVRVGGGILDAEPFLNGGDTAPEGEGQVADAGSDRPAADADGDDAAGPDREPVAPFSLSARRLDAVYFGSDRYLQNVDLDLVRSEQGWEQIGFLGEVPPSLARPRGDDKDGDGQAAEAPKILRIVFSPKEGGGKRLLIKADDMGAVLRAIDQMDTVIGGRLEIVGQSGGPMPSHPLNASIEARDYVVVDAPVLARLLTVASLTGISDLMSGEGIRFDRLVGEFALQDGRMQTELIRAYGPALGLTAQGTIDFARSGTDLQGTVVPAYSVNRVLDKIPLLGRLLTGGEGEGFIAVTYEMSGRLDDPEIKVNALSALAPGFLRGLFNTGGDEKEQPRALPERIEP